MDSTISEEALGYNLSLAVATLSRLGGFLDQSRATLTLYPGLRPAIGF